MSECALDVAHSSRLKKSERRRRFFGQPWPLVHIFGVETWERFSYYGMQAILLHYARRAHSCSRSTSCRSRSAARCPARSCRGYDEHAEAPYFLTLGLATMGLGLVTFVAAPVIMRLIRGVR